MIQKRHPNKNHSRGTIFYVTVFRSEVYGLVLWPLGTYYVGRYIAGELGHGSTFLKYELWKYKTDIQRNAAEKDDRYISWTFAT